jgi:hypothetical protein
VFVQSKPNSTAVSTRVSSMSRDWESHPYEDVAVLGIHDEKAADRDGGIQGAAAVVAKRDVVWEGRRGTRAVGGEETGYLRGGSGDLGPEPVSEGIRAE